MSAPQKPIKGSKAYEKFRQALEKMDRSELGNLEFRRYSRDMKRLIIQEKKLRKSSNKGISKKETTDILIKMVEVLRPEQAATFKNRYQNPPKKPTLERSGEAKKQALLKSKKNDPNYTHAYCTFKMYHEDVSKKVGGISFNSKFWTLGLKAQKYIAGSSTCSNPSCSKEWEHKKIGMVIRGSREPEVLDYHVFVRNQRCKSCGSLALMQLKKTTYVKIVARQLNEWKEEDQPSRHDLGYCEECKTRKCPNLKPDGVEGHVTSALGKLHL
ncbi:hypothetical protein AOL_s00007g274 [Orbilia oligospora ATCC 24927]|uniref:3CxxC-type domain-containing protein n=2 Tax=Orbilia oligospora TaxID=2813651 RepID=G1X1W5_ARTOA|nr:hypothetical protein AOL_s00007g274 [Orbilia oligospora ATCC 24927]EGX52938.1 hypothetical protein AOL_s00007g274 [Orbilia oligospora ATCC 24927]KAF3277440.1 hypothetical protein TWF970_005051 [Orbilia oligospora]